jgi:hypothetical protein
MGDLCLVAGPVASVAVQFVKRFPVVQRYPKVILALLTGAYVYTMGTGLECWVAAFASGIAGYEVVIKPVVKKE